MACAYHPKLFGRPRSGRSGFHASLGKKVCESPSHLNRNKLGVVVYSGHPSKGGKLYNRKIEV
jgi:hypothetical protein